MRYGLARAVACTPGRGSVPAPRGCPSQGVFGGPRSGGEADPGDAAIRAGRRNLYGSWTACCSVVVMAQRTFRNRAEVQAWNDEMVGKYDLDRFHNHPSVLVRWIEQAQDKRRLFSLLEVEVGDNAVSNGDQTASSGTLSIGETGAVWTGDIPVGATGIAVVLFSVASVLIHLS